MPDASPANPNAKDTLIALMNNPRDFTIAQEQGWYRIPVRSAPVIVREEQVKYLAFYHTKIFAEEAFSIRWCGEVRNLSIVRRRDLFPDLAYDPKANNEYYKIEFHPLCPLPQPVMSRRLRRILFISTTFARLQQARELNDIFQESPLEEKLWDAFKAEEIEAERQFMVGSEHKFYLLDFALFCRDRNINIECDGDAFHSKLADVKRDKKRNTFLESLGWSVLRFTTDDIFHHLYESVQQIKKTINRYGGLSLTDQLGTLRRFPDDSSNQMLLFQ
jgi:very-short-patch-repair endonuclease